MFVATELGAAVSDYVARESTRLRGLWRGEAEQEVQVEKLSAAFVTGADVTYDGMTVDDPVRGKAVCRFTNITWRPEAERVLTKLDGLGIDRLVYARGGGPYHPGFGAKALINWEKGMRELVNQAGLLWERDWWQDDGLPRVVDLWSHIGEKAQNNLGYLMSITDTEERQRVAISDKLPTTGTGWAGEISTREKFGRNIMGYGSRVELGVREYVADFIEMVQHFPQDGGTLRTVEDFRGTLAGSRSDASYTAWDATHVEVETGVRKIAMSPLSALFNRTLTDTRWQADTFTRFMPPGWKDPHTVEAHIESLCAPPASADWITTDMLVAVDADFGWTDAPAIVRINGDKLEWTRAKETVKFGADQIVLRGMFMQAAEGRRMPYYLSGDPGTMLGYLPFAGWALYDAMERLQCLTTAGVTQIGDDMCIRIKAEHVPLLMADMGPWLRTKGMHGNLTFREGVYIYWPSPDKVYAFIAPRVMKTVTSPQELYELPTLKKGDTRHLDVDAETAKMVGDVWRAHGDLFFFEGTPRDWRSMLEQRWQGGAQALSKVGVMEWTQYMFEEAAINGE